MSRSRKKPFVTISKVWDKFKERSFRCRIKRACRDAEIDFDPDSDFLELGLGNKKLGSWGTALGFDVAPDEADSTWVHEEFNRLKRK